ncbi:PQQ-dependent sugar dehydrogenase [Fulvivirgaceae bacterium BMA12]|uniref:PQQ-dependent sugar dehydrogenase n=1 Tax=Agaribacillus aureus TaxID=3051825 RepID=A0ABT8L5K6_9BACT|nr:PQQ-dependent sugar dehydrogenase [Fulvivirgaceae bacterium BMA12]
MNYFTQFFFVCLSFLIATGCNPVEEQDAPFAENLYLGHLQLDSSVLVITKVAAELEVPWEVTYGSDGWVWFTEHKGTVNHLNPETGQKKVLLQLPDVHYKKSTGLLGMALHPDLAQHPYVYLHYNILTSDDGYSEKVKSRLVRYTYQNDTLTAPKVLLDSIPGKTFHNGSRLTITQDHKLLFSMGDIGDLKYCQDPTKFNGKIHRFNLDGSIPEDNPFPNLSVWSWGHRNPQGLVAAPNGYIYSSEHGPHNDDEINLIRKRGNYGWPDVAGYIDRPNEEKYSEDSTVIEPLIAWTPTIAVAGLDYYHQQSIPEWQNSLLLVNLKGQALRVLNLDDRGETITGEHIFFQKYFGRMRDLCVAPNGDVYLATSNRDWHPRLQPWMYDSLPAIGDRIIRLQRANKTMLAQLEKMTDAVALKEDPEALVMDSEVWDYEPTGDVLTDGKGLYTRHCVSCHRADGTGAPGLIPPLGKTEWVTGNRSRLIQILLKGLSKPIEVNGVTYEQEMPPFASLSDQEIASILTYIRNSFGNEADAVIAGHVFEERRLK